MSTTYDARFATEFFVDDNLDGICYFGCFDVRIKIVMDNQNDQGEKDVAEFECSKQASILVSDQLFSSRKSVFDTPSYLLVGCQLLC